jgi:hypothetical protein
MLREIVRLLRLQYSETKPAATKPCLNAAQSTNAFMQSGGRLSSKRRASPTFLEVKGSSSRAVPVAWGEAHAPACLAQRREALVAQNPSQLLLGR